MKTIGLLTVFTCLFLLQAIDLKADSCCPKNKSNNKSVQYIDKTEVQKMIKESKDLVIIDVLSPESYSKGHIKGAINIPLAKLNEKEVLNSLDKNKTYIVYCANKRCKASTKAAKLLLNNGFKKVFDYENGIAEWKAENLPLGTAKSGSCEKSKTCKISCK